MERRTSRTLPAVGHKMPLVAVFSGLLKGTEQLDIGMFNNAAEIIHTSSGSAALVLSLEACKLASRRRKVIIPAYTCPSVLAAVEKTGLQAVLCDLAPGKLSIDNQRLEDLLDGDTLAVVYVHLFGLDRRVNIDRKMIKDAGVWLIEDAAQAFGNMEGDIPIGSDGDLTILSFGRGKPLSALHGGAVIVNSSDLREYVHEAWRKWGTPQPMWFCIYYRVLLVAYTILFHPKFFGLPSKLPWFRIGETIYIDQISVHEMDKSAKCVLNLLIKNRSEIQHIRSRIAKQYLKKLMPYARHFSYMPSIEDLGTGPIRFPLCFQLEQHKTKCLERLTNLRLGASGSYPFVLNAQPGVPDYVARQGPFPSAQALATGILTLPTHDHVRERDISAIIKIIEEMTL